jgi:integrase
MDQQIPPRTFAIPPRTYSHLAFDAAIDDGLVTDFARDHRGPRPSEADGRTSQEADYAQKVRTFRADYERMTGEPLTVDGLGGPRIDWVLSQRRDPATGRPVRLGTRNAYRRVLGSLVSWLGQRVSKPIVFAGKVERPDGEADPVTFSEGDLKRVLGYLRRADTITSRRLIAAMFIAIDAGPRAGEIAHLLISGLDRGTSRARIDRKGLKQREIPLSSASWRELDRYLAVRRSDLGHVFVSDDGSAPLTSKALSAQLRRVLDKLELRVALSKADIARQPDLTDVPRQEIGLSFHALRRTFLGIYRRSGRSWQEIQAIMGWSAEYAAQVVRHYDRVNAADLRAVHDQRSPLARFGGPRAA